jgi:pSer/pThr/pTyr-binding forkhead associated (FHA) protein
MAQQARLIERGPTPEQTRQVPLKQGEFLIGRGPDCDLRLPISAISRHHCIIRLTDNEATLLDLGSSNGTYLNGQRVRSQAALHSGDDLRVGTCHFLVGDLGLCNDKPGRIWLGWLDLPGWNGRHSGAPQGHVRGSRRLFK